MYRSTTDRIYYHEANFGRDDGQIVSGNQMTASYSQEDVMSELQTSAHSPASEPLPFPPVSDVQYPPGELQFGDDALDSLPLQEFHKQYQGRDPSAPYLPSQIFPPSASSETAQTPFTDRRLYDDFVNTLVTFHGPSQPRRYSFVSEAGSPTDGSVKSTPLPNRSPFDLTWKHRHHQYLTVPNPASEHSSRASATSSEKRQKEPKQCLECGKWLAGQDGLRHHTSTHDKDKKANYREKCDFCDDRFKAPKDRIRHELKHTNVRALRCNFPECGKKLKARMDNAKRHVIKQHEVDRAFALSFISSSQET